MGKNICKTLISNKTVSEISSYVIGWVVNYCTADAYFMLHQVIVIFLRCFDRKYRSVVIRKMSRAGSLMFKSQPVKSGTELPTARHRCGISLKEAMFSQGAKPPKMGPANPLHALT